MWLSRPNGQIAILKSLQVCDFEYLKRDSPTIFLLLSIKSHILESYGVFFFYWTRRAWGPALCLAHVIIAMYSVDEITWTFTISGLAGRFEKRFRIHIVNKVHWGYSLCFIHLLCSFLDLAVLLVFGEVATSGEALSHKCSPTCGLKQTCPVRDINRLYWSRCSAQSWT